MSKEVRTLKDPYDEEEDEDGEHENAGWRCLDQLPGLKILSVGKERLALDAWELSKLTSHTVEHR